MVVECADQFWTACFLEGKMVAAVDSLNFKAKGVGERLRATAAWSSDVNTQQNGVQWHMQVEDARIKLTSVYPKIMM